MNNNSRLEFKVYHKPMSKNDRIHFYSHHNTKIKSGILIGFFLRALRICTPKFLDEEFEHISRSFTSLQYPIAFIQRAKSKALKIHKRKYLPNISSNISSENNSLNRHIVLLHNNSTYLIERNLNQLGIKTVTRSSITIKKT